MKFIKSESVLYLKITLLWKTYLWIQEQTLPILVISIVSIAYRSLRHNLLFERLKSPDQTAVMKITLLNVKEHNLICLTRRRLQHIKFSPGNMSWIHRDIQGQWNVILCTDVNDKLNVIDDNFTVFTLSKIMCSFAILITCCIQW